MVSAVTKPRVSNDTPPVRADGGAASGGLAAAWAGWLPRWRRDGLPCRAACWPPPRDRRGGPGVVSGAGSGPAVGYGAEAESGPAVAVAVAVAGYGAGVGPAVAKTA